MDEKKIDILLSKADLFKICCVGSGGVFLIELLNDVPDQVTMFGSLTLTAVSIIALVITWDKAQRLTNKGK